jgi:gamma-glutamylcyclotransferase (GGCT)/AIG2-like uncharacterized protein YtfP
MHERLFVYGTLAPGRSNAHMLSHLPGSWQRATIRGHLVHAGWGAEQGYPAVVIDASGTAVEGFVLYSDALGPEWKRLDEFEGDQYQRVASQAQLEDGQVVEVYVYQLKQ